MKRLFVIISLLSLCCVTSAQDVVHPFSAYPAGSAFVHKDLVTISSDTLSTRCKPCILEMEELNRIALTYKDNPKVRFVAVACDDSASVAEFLKTHPMEFQLVALERTVFENTFSVSFFPVNILIDADRKVVEKKIGGTLKPDQVQDELRPLVIRLGQLLDGK